MSIQNISGLGQVVQATAEYTDQSVVDIYQQNLSNIKVILDTRSDNTGPNADPFAGTSLPTDGSAWTALMRSLQALNNLAQNGSTVNGNTYYMLPDMITSYALVSKSLAAAGISATAPPVTDVTIQNNLIQAWQTLAGFGVEGIVNGSVGIFNVGNILTGSLTPNMALATRTLQSMVEIDYVKAGNDYVFGQLGSLESYLSTSNGVLNALNTVQGISNQITVSNPTNFAFPPKTDADFGMTGAALSAALMSLQGMTYAADARNSLSADLQPFLRNAGFNTVASAALGLLAVSTASPISLRILNTLTNTEDPNILLVRASIEQASLGHSFGGAQFTTWASAANFELTGGGTGLFGGRVDPIETVDSYLSLYLSAAGYATAQSALVAINNGVNNPYLNFINGINAANTNHFLDPKVVGDLNVLGVTSIQQVLTLPTHLPVGPLLSSFHADILAGVSAAGFGSQTGLAQALSTLIAGNSSAFTHIYQILASAHFTQLFPTVTGVNAQTVISLQAAKSTLLSLLPGIEAQAGQPSAGVPNSFAYFIKTVASEISTYFVNNPGNGISAVTQWILDNQNKRQGTAGSGLAGLLQTHITQAISQAESVNTQQQENVRNYMFIFQEFYLSASDVLQKVTQIIEKNAQNIAK